MRGVLQGLDGAVVEAISRKNSTDVPKEDQDKSKINSKLTNVLPFLMTIICLNLIYLNFRLKKDKLTEPTTTGLK